ncbi:MAG: hypothetical protein C0514_07535 [Candidatus Puniceispirillum sp.]|nr:hypothetical protein [Candidatus Puniceispirillum sp.]
MKRAAYLSLVLSSILTPSLFASAEEILGDDLSLSSSQGGAPLNPHHDEGFLFATYKLNNRPTSEVSETKLLKKATKLKALRMALKAEAAEETLDIPGQEGDAPAPSSSGRMIFGMAAPSAAKVMIDLRPTCSPIQDQGNTGSCTAHSLEGALEQAMIRKTGKYVHFSRLAGYFHARARMGKSERNELEYLNQDSGATIGDAALSVFSGLIPETLWPYKDDGRTFKKQPLPSCYEAGLRWLNTTGISFVKVDGTKEGILAQLKDGKPVMFGMALRKSFMSSEVARTGMVPVPSPSEDIVGGHAMLIVGYNGDTQRFIVRNSWSEKWGDKGYAHIPEALIIQPDVTYDLWRVSDVVNIQTVDEATQKSLERAHASKATLGTKALPQPVTVLDESIIDKAKAKKSKRPFAMTLARTLEKQNAAQSSAVDEVA